MLNFGDMLETIEAAIDPDYPAYIQGDTIVSWGEAARLSNNLARQLMSRGEEPGNKVAIYMRNCPDYLIALAAALKARLVPVNVNYRYSSDELIYLLDNADATTVFYGAEFRDRIEDIRGRLPGIAQWIETGASDTPDFAISMRDLTGDGDGDPVAIERSPDDLLFIYTGGTTGMPKGVMWPHGNLRNAMVAPARTEGPIPETLAELTAFIASGAHGPSVLPAPPLMHGTGLVVALNAMLFGGTVVMLAAKTFDPAEMLRMTEIHRPKVLVIVGDSFARPLLDELQDHPDRYDLSSVGTVLSSGVIWSVEIKRGLLRFMPGAVMADSLGSSEALGLASSIMTAGQEVHTARFTIGPRCRVLAEDGSWVEPGSGIPGMLAIGPPNPIGYYKDKAKSDATLPTIDGQRYCIPGDWCMVEADGSLTFLGRGSGCINTGGEKVFPEEVEEALKTHDAVADALVVGAPDAKWGQAIVAVVELRRGAALNVESLRSHVRSRLAGYKVPKDIVCAAEPLRAANGKADYATARAQAIDARGGAA